MRTATIKGSTVDQDFHHVQDDAHDRWLYRTIYSNDPLSRLTVFKYMVDDEADGVPLELQQRQTLTDPYPKGLSFFLLCK